LSPGCVNCTAVFDLVAWWTTEKRALERARKALRLRKIWPSDHDEPFAAIFAALPIPQRWIDARDPNGRACCDTPRSGAPMLFENAR
jgi:hypothetical protein